jgi:hypothetical protein
MIWIEKIWHWFLGQQDSCTPNEDPQHQVARDSVASDLSGQQYKSQLDQERDYLARWFSHRLHLISIDCLVASYEFVLEHDLAGEDMTEEVIHVPEYYFCKSVLRGIQMAIDRGERVPTHLTSDAVWELWMNGEHTYRMYCELRDE